jgi:hypothetical protein
MFAARPEFAAGYGNNHTQLFQGLNLSQVPGVKNRDWDPTTYHHSFLGQFQLDDIDPRVLYGERKRMPKIVERYLLGNKRPWTSANFGGKYYEDRNRREQLKALKHSKLEYELPGQGSNIPYQRLFTLHIPAFKNDAERMKFIKALSPEELKRIREAVNVTDWYEPAAQIREIVPLESGLEPLRRSFSFYDHYK